MAFELIESPETLLQCKAIYDAKLGEERFPVVFVPPANQPVTLADLVSGIQQHKSRLEQLLKTSGAILLRGFPVRNGEDFAQVVEAFGYKSMGYEAGAAARSHVSGPVFTANQLPLHYPIGFHNEMAYLPDYPDVVMFFCEIAPPEGGATGIVPGRLVYERMMEDYPDFVADLRNKGLVYYNVLGEEQWRNEFGTDKRAEAELKAAKLSKKLTWLQDGSVKVCQGPHPGIKKLPARDCEVWFNNIGSSSPSISNIPNCLLEFGDGSSLPADAVRACLTLMSQEQVALQWKAGDIVVLNNHAVLHCRHPSKPPRRILVSMLKTETMTD